MIKNKLEHERSTYLLDGKNINHDASGTAFNCFILEVDNALFICKLLHQKIRLRFY